MAFTTWSTSRLNAVTLSGGNLVATGTSSSGCVIAADPQSSGKWYYEITINTYAASGTCVGLASGDITLSTFLSNNAYGTFVIKSGGIFVNATGSGKSLGALSAGVLICIAVDLDNRLIWFRSGASGSWNATSGTANDPATGTGGVNFAGIGAGGAYEFYPLAGLATTSDQVTANFGASSFTGTVPSGYNAGWTSGVSPTTNVVVTQAGSATWVVPTSPDLRVTQTGSATWVTNPNPPLRITHAGVEAWVVPNPPLRITQAGVIRWVDVSSIAASISGVSATGGAGSLTTTSTLPVGTLTLTPEAFTVAVDVAISQGTLILTGQDFTGTFDLHPVIIPIDTVAELLLTAIPFSISYVPPFLQLTQLPVEVPGTNTAALHLTQTSIEASTTGAADLHVTQEFVEASVNTGTSYLHGSQYAVEAAAARITVPFRLSQIGLEVLRGFPTHPGWNVDPTIVTPIYPVLPGLGYVVKRSILEQTTIQPHVSGKETRLGQWSQTIYTYELTYELLRDWPTYDEYRLMEAFWLGRQGRYGVFLFDDVDDDVRVGQFIATGNGKETQYQLHRTIGATGHPGWDDDIHAPIAVTAVYIDGLLQDPSTWDVTFWQSNLPGVLAFHAAVPAGMDVTVDFSYYWPCHFTEDTATFEQFMHQFWELKQVKFETVKPNNVLLLPHPENLTNAATILYTPTLP